LQLTRRVPPSAATSPPLPLPSFPCPNFPAFWWVCNAPSQTCFLSLFRTWAGTGLSAARTFLHYANAQTTLWNAEEAKAPSPYYFVAGRFAVAYCAATPSTHILTILSSSDGSARRAFLYGRRHLLCSVQRGRACSSYHHCCTTLPSGTATTLTRATRQTCKPSVRGCVVFV